MNPEQTFLNKWRDLAADRQQEVLDFLDFVWQKSLREKTAQTPPTLTIDQRVKQWRDWASSHPLNSPGLPDEALHRDSIYDD